jgi:alkylation response protein AidB-like acyl-CoA dehydrogenase
MDLLFLDQEKTFRATVRQFFRESVTPGMRAIVRSGFHVPKEFTQQWHRTLAKKGWSTPYWPEAFGGPGWSGIQRHIFEEEYARADAPPLSPFGVKLVAPVIYTYGTKEQTARYLPSIRDGSVFWCQGFSEVGAGSDLSAVKTRAIRDGDDYVISGHKIWQTDAHHAEMIVCLVRTQQTDRQQEGLSFIVMPMDAPGLTVGPIITIDGARSVNEVFLDNVRVPATNLVGEEGKGWSYAKFLLNHERIGNARYYRTLRDFNCLKAFASEARDGDRPMLADPDFARKMARMEIDIVALGWMVLDLICGNVPHPPAAASALKVKGSEMHQRIAELSLEAIGSSALAAFGESDLGRSGNLPTDAPIYAVGKSASYFYRRAATIYAGSNEVQKTIISQTLGRA